MATGGLGGGNIYRGLGDGNMGFWRWQQGVWRFGNKGFGGGNIGVGDGNMGFWRWQHWV